MKDKESEKNMGSEKRSSYNVSSWKFAVMESNRLGLDDAFSFECDNCGGCCKDQGELLLNPYDIFRMAGKMGLQPQEWLDLYTEAYIGSGSRVPVVRIRMIGKERHCPFLENNRCTMQSQKPDVCALYPLGRAGSISGDPKEAGEEEPEVMYFHSGCRCGRDRDGQTVRKWLDSFGLMEREQFFLDWTGLVLEASGFMRGLEQENENEEIMQMFLSLLYIQMYADYEIHIELSRGRSGNLLCDSSLDFGPQFRKNRKEIRENIRKIQEMRRKAS